MDARTWPCPAAHESRPLALLACVACLALAPMLAGAAGVRTNPVPRLAPPATIPAPAKSPPSRSRDATSAELRSLAHEVKGQGWIVYTARSTQGDWDLFACRPDGSDARPLTRTPQFSEFYAQVSRDGRRILYRRLPRGGPVDANRHGAQGEPMLANSDGTSPEPLGHAGEFPWASWSPDGRRIACLDLTGIHLVDLATRRRLRSFPRLGFFQQMTWSPDGAWLLGVANGFAKGWTVARLNLESGEAVPVNRLECCTPDWFADSQRVIFSWRPPGQRGEDDHAWTQLWMASADGESRRLLYAEEGRNLYGGFASPDGRYVVFNGNQRAGGDPEHEGSPMRVLRVADAPIIGDEHLALRILNPQAKSGPVLTLPKGWEPAWTAAELFGRSGSKPAAP